MSACGVCSHDASAHYPYARGKCEWIIPAGGLKNTCRCERFRSMESLLAQRVAVILLFVMVLGSLPRIVDLVVGA